MWTDPGPGVTPPSPAETLETTLLVTGVQGSGSAILNDLTQNLTLFTHSRSIFYLFSFTHEMMNNSAASVLSFNFISRQEADDDI